MNYKSLCIFTLTISCLALGQDKIIYGSVLDADSKNPISNVNISSLPSGNGTQTNNDGEFRYNHHISDSILLVQHIGYQRLEIPITQFNNNNQIYIYRRVIQLDEVGITGNNRKEFKPFETENSVIEISAENLSSNSFVDAADVLYSLQAVSVKEDTKGKKTLSIRGAADEEMIYMYDGIRINNMSDHLFDLSTFNISGISRIDMVLGSHSKGLASSGIINFIPKLSHGSDLSFIQRFGTYNSGSWSGTGSIGNSLIGLTTGLMKEESSQIYEGETLPDILTINQNYFTNLGLRNNKNHELRIFNIISNRKYIDKKTKDSLNLDFKTFIGKFIASYPNKGFISIYFLTQAQNSLSYSSIYNGERYSKNGGYGAQFQYPIYSAKLNLEISNNNLESDWNLSVGEIIAKRSIKVITGTFEFNGKKSKSDLQLQSLKIILNQESIQDEYKNVVPIYDGDIEWNEKGSQLALSLFIPKNDKNIYFYGNLGTYFRLPSLQEQFSTQLKPADEKSMLLVPEFKHTREVGFKLEGNPSIKEMDYNMGISGFNYYYNDKIKQIQYSGSNIKFPINYGRASMSGLDANLKLWSPNKMLHSSILYSFYIYSDQIAFPLQPVKMFRGKIIYNWRGVSIEYLMRSQSSRIWTSVSDDGQYFDNQLPPIVTYDTYASYKYIYRSFTLSFGISIRNLTNNTQYLDGISIYDRRVYLTTEVLWK